MSLKTVFYGVFLFKIITFSDVKSDNIVQSSNRQGFDLFTRFMQDNNFANQIIALLGTEGEKSTQEQNEIKNLRKEINEHLKFEQREQQHHQQLQVIEEQRTLNRAKLNMIEGELELIIARIEKQRIDILISEEQRAESRQTLVKHLQMLVNVHKQIENQFLQMQRIYEQNKRKSMQYVYQRRVQEQKLSQIVKELDAFHQNEQNHILLETPAKNQAAEELRMKEKITLAQLELKVREQVERIHQQHASNKPMNEEYAQEIRKLNQASEELQMHVQNIHKRRTQEQLAQENIEVVNLAKKLNAHIQYEQQQRAQEHVEVHNGAREKRMQDQRAQDQLVLKLQELIQQLQMGHASKPLTNEQRFQIKNQLTQHWNKLQELTKSIDERRIQDRRVQEQQRLNELKEKLKAYIQNEEHQRSLEIPPTNQVALNLRTKEQLILKQLQQKVQESIQRIQERHTRSAPINQEHIQEINKLNQACQELQAHKELIDERRERQRRIARGPSQYQQIPQETLSKTTGVLYEGGTKRKFSAFTAHTGRNHERGGGRHELGKP